MEKNMNSKFQKMTYKRPVDTRKLTQGHYPQENKNKTIMQFHLTPVRKVTIWKWKIAATGNIWRKWYTNPLLVEI